MRSAQGINSGC